MFRSFTIALLWLLISAGLPTLCLAGTIYDVTIDIGANTTADYGSSLALDLTLTDYTGAGGNTVTFTNFDFGGGAAISPAWYTTGSNYSTSAPYGSPDSARTGMSGVLSGTVSIANSDTSYLSFNEFTQGFHPGATLTFQLSLPSNPDVATFPDNLALRLLPTYNSPDNTAGDYISTTAPDGTSLLNVDLTSNPSVQTFSSTNSDITITAQLEGSGPANVVPEPATLTLMLLGLSGLAVRVGWFRVNRSFW